MTRLWWSGGRDNTTSAPLQLKSCSIRVCSLSCRKGAERLGTRNLQANLPAFPENAQIRAVELKEMACSGTSLVSNAVLTKDLRTFRSDYFSSASGQASPPRVSGLSLGILVHSSPMHTFPSFGGTTTPGYQRILSYSLLEDHPFSRRFSISPRRSGGNNVWPVI
jgi:hypothetical protein